jgi:regulator of protease activity HflC (stomatin/prohibitin superfamily)
LLGRAPLSAFDLKSSGNPIAPYPSITVQHGRIDEKHEDTLLARFGGPGNVTIFNDSAVSLERFGRFTRVAGPGKIFLRRFERIHAVLDLRPQERSSTAKAVTKDGIPVQAEVQVRFQLARPPANQVPPTPDAPHPVYKWALVHAGQCHKYIVIKEKGEEAVLSWADQVGVGGAMRATIADHKLDKLLEPFEPGRDPRREISGSLQRAANNSARNIGAEVLEVRMGPLEPTLEEVTQERISSWQVAWASRARKEEARGEAEAIRQRGQARAYAQMGVILTLTREFQELVERDETLSAEFVALRFIEALRQAWARPGGIAIPSEAVRTLDYLQRMVRQEYTLPRADTAHERP